MNGKRTFSHKVPVSGQIISNQGDRGHVMPILSMSNDSMSWSDVIGKRYQQSLLGSVSNVLTSVAIPIWLQDLGVGLWVCCYLVFWKFWKAEKRGRIWPGFWGGDWADMWRELEFQKHQGLENWKRTDSVSVVQQYGLTGFNRVQMDWRMLQSSQNNILLLPSLAAIKKEKLIWFERLSPWGFGYLFMDGETSCVFFFFKDQ